MYNHCCYYFMFLKEFFLFIVYILRKGFFVKGISCLIGCFFFCNFDLETFHWPERNS